MSDIHGSDERDDAGWAQRGRHPVNIGHLVMGMAFLGLLAVWTIVQADVVDNEDIRWLLPVPWVLAGAAGLAASVLAGRRTPQRQVAGWVPPAGPEPEPGPGAPAGPAEGYDGERLS
jgi:hypothetical protein